MCELGLGLYANSKIYQQHLNKNFLFENRSVFLNNVDEDLTTALKNINSQKNDVYFLDTHLNFKLKKNLMNKMISFPVTTLFERDSILINSEGRVQKAYKSVTSNLVARNSEDVLNAINFISNKNKLSNMTLKNLYLNAPFLNFRAILRDKFYFNFLNMLSLILKTILYFLSLIIPLLIAVAYFTLIERQVLAAVQRRQGPNIVGFFGLLQPLADGLKLFLKETILPKSSNMIIFILAPVFTFALSLAG